MWTYFSLLVDKCPGVQLLGCMIIECLVLHETPKLFFQNGCTVLHSLQQCMSYPLFCIHQHLVGAIIFCFSHYNGWVKWHLIVVLMGAQCLMRLNCFFPFFVVFFLFLSYVHMSSAFAVFFNEGAVPVFYLCSHCLWFFYCWVLKVLFIY